MMWNVLIVEDEVAAYENLVRMLENHQQKFQLKAWVRSIAESVKWLSANQLPDLIFLDVQLGDGLSFAIFDEIEIDCPVIFTTAFEEHALKAFELDSIDYLLKPFSQDQFNKSILKFTKRSSLGGINPEVITKLIGRFQDEKVDYKERFHIKKGSKLIVVKIAEIAWFRLDDYVYLMTNSGQKFKVDYSLDQLQSLLNPMQFYRLNRQVIAKIDAIESIDTHFNYKLKIKLKPPLETDVFVAKDKASVFKKWLG